MPMSNVKDIFISDVNRGCLDERVVQALFELIDLGDIQEMYQ